MFQFIHKDCGGTVSYWESVRCNLRFPLIREEGENFRGDFNICLRQDFEDEILDAYIRCDNCYKEFESSDYDEIIENPSP